ncbi:hypothetical protein ACJMK2_042255 [Sinanodonta woodiana]|uniref:Uncharacterized protein n=1 Tax=Sinanodonta woodiana TaxID=1069815 RepID=A0ABD3WA00_SINWO
MTLEDSKSFASNVLDYINKLLGNNFKVVNFWRFTEQLHIHDLLSLPYMCLVVLHIWMKNKNGFIEISDIIFDIIRNYLHRATSDQQRKSIIEDVSYITSINLQNDQTTFLKWNIEMEHRYALHVLSRIAAHIFLSKIETEPVKANVPQLVSITDSDLKRMCETGLLTEPLSLSAKNNISNMSFPGRLICEFFVSMFIALQEGKDFDFIFSNRTTSLQNSMIIDILYQLSDTRTKAIIHKAIETSGKEKIPTKGDQRRNDLNEKSLFFIHSSDSSSIQWLQWHMNNDACYANKLLFMSTALHCIDTITSLELTNHDNNENLVFHLPFLPVLKMLKLDIYKCTLRLCKEWGNHVPCKLEQSVIKSVKINTATLSVLTKSLSLCAGLERLELFPSILWTDDDIVLQNKSGGDNYSWNKLSKQIENNQKLKILELNNLMLPGVVDTLISRLNRYQNLETLKLKNASSIIQDQPPLYHAYDINKDDDFKPHTTIKLTQLSLERLQLQQSPINFLFHTERNEEPINNSIKVLYISALEMPKTSWETFACQIGNMRLTEFRLSNVNSGDSLQIILNSIGEIKTMECLSFHKIGTGKITQNFSFLSNMKALSKL